jgi:hypothetical protein
MTGKQLTRLEIAAPALSRVVLTAGRVIAGERIHRLHWFV